MATSAPHLPPSRIGLRSVAGWSAVALAGASALGWLALSRGEPVSAAWMLVAALCTYAIGYRFYSAFIAANVFALDDNRPTPAHRLADGRDYVPTNRWIVFGHHFAAIAGPGPLVGPTLAAQFGYLPGVLWIVVGVVLGGAVQDFVILCASVRRDGKSLGEMAREEIGPVAGVTAMVAVLGIMIVLIAVLGLVVVNALRSSPWGTVTIGLTIPIAMLMGSYMRWFRPGRVLEASAIGVVLLALSLYAGRWAATTPGVAELFTLSGKSLALLVMVYGFAASVLPVWLLLAPRDYLSAFVKIGVVIALAVGIVVALPPLQMPALTQFTDGTGPVFAGPLFPFAFITIACGSISGFHALIASGTTPKLLDRESDARIVGYGAMLMESFVAIMALIAACALSPGVYFAINAPVSALGSTAQSAATAIAQWGFVVTPQELESLARQVGESSLLSRTGGAPSLAVGMAHIFSRVLGGTEGMALWYHFAIMFEALFILTTLDAGTRVGRYMLQDLARRVWAPLGRSDSAPAMMLMSALFVAMWGHFLWQGVIDPLGGINSLWPLFGISNQLLAAVALCVGTTIIMRMGKMRYALVTLLPLVWLVIVTMSAGVYKLFSSQPKLGFLAHARSLEGMLRAGTLPAGVKSTGELRQLIANDYLDAAVAGFFLVSVIVVLVASAHAWWTILRRRNAFTPFRPISMRLPLVLIAIATLPAALVAQSGVPATSNIDFSIQNLMRGPELYGRAPSTVRWTADGKWIYFQWNEAGTDWREPLRQYRARAEAGAKPERLTNAQADSAAPYFADGLSSPDGSARVVEANGDVYVVSFRDGSARRITQTVATESQPSWSADGRTVYFLRDNNAYSVSLSDGFSRQLTDIRVGPAPTDSAAAKGQRGVLERQQRELFDVVRDRLLADSIAKAERKARELAGLQPIYLAATERVSSVSVSPNGQAALVVVVLPGAGTRQTEVPQFVTTSGYVENLRLRTKVGDVTGKQRVLWIALPSGKAKPLDLFGADSAGNVALAGWNDDGSRAALFVYPNSRKIRRLVTVRSDTAALTTIETLRDTAWVGGPCSSCAGWYDGGRRLWYVSESTGFAQLYSAAPTGGDVRPLTQGKWEVLAVAPSADRRDFYITTNELSPFEQQLYRLPASGGTRTRLTSESGGHTAVLSPNGRLIADVYSFVNRPPDLYLATNGSNASPVRLTTSPSAEFLKVSWLAPALVQIPASDGASVPAHIYRPQDMGAQPNGAAVIFVHGAGYLHNVGNFWSQYPREYLFNQYLAKHGYVVLDLDYRASAGYGRDWRTAIYRWMGGRDLADHADASAWLTKTYGIPGARVGIYGGSYGGFITLMALFTEQDRFGAGAALRSVTDWAHYNEGYTSAILNRPQDDSVAYRRSSPIYFANGLRAPLLMAHGMVDQNVQYQDIVRLQQRLIELGKTDWTLASYPVEDHAFVRPSSWTDEYRRIFELFERSIAVQGGAPRATGAASSAPR